MPDLTLFEASTPERLIAGIGAGLWVDGGDWGCCVGGFGVYAGGFFGVVDVEMAGW